MATPAGDESNLGQLPLHVCFYVAQRVLLRLSRGVYISDAPEPLERRQNASTTSCSELQVQMYSSYRIKAVKVKRC